MRKARKGTRVVFIPGNHDEFARHYTNTCFGDVLVADEIVHHTAAGKRLLVLHGDAFDGVVCHARWLAVLGDQAYSSTIW